MSGVSGAAGGGDGGRGRISSEQVILLHPRRTIKEYGAAPKDVVWVYPDRRPIEGFVIRNVLPEDAAHLSGYVGSHLDPIGGPAPTVSQVRLLLGAQGGEGDDDRVVAFSVAGAIVAFGAVPGNIIWAHVDRDPVEVKVLADLSVVGVKRLIKYVEEGHLGPGRYRGTTPTLAQLRKCLEPDRARPLLAQKHSP